MRVDYWTSGYQLLSVRARKIIRNLGLDDTDKLFASDFRCRGAGPKTVEELRAFRRQLKRMVKRGRV